MSETTHLGLPHLAAAQAQKHVTHNEALTRLDAVVQLAVIDTTLTAPPGSPGEGDRYIVAAGATGAWTGHTGEIAAFIDGAWLFIAAGPGWTAFDEASEAVLVRHGGNWVPVGSFLGAVDRFGVNTTADATNRLAVRSNAVLFAGVEAAEGGTGDVRFVVNKEADGDTASLLFQSGFSGRAEVGLAGDTDFVFKVSADGSAWSESIRIDKDTGFATILYDNTGSGLVATNMQDAIDEVAAGGGGGTVASVFGRTGAVVAATGDYDAAEVDFTPAGGIAASTVQAAIEELDAEKLGKAGGTMTGFVTLHADPDSAMKAATKQYVDQIVAAQDAMVFKGVVDCSTNPNYPAADRGHTYRVSVAGKIGGGSGVNVEAGDLLLCLADGTASGDQATVGSSWSIAQANLDGAVIGPASATDSHLAQFDGTTGRLLKGGKAAPAGTVVGTSDTQTLTNKTLTSPVINAPTGITAGDVGSIPLLRMAGVILSGCEISNGSDATNDLDLAAGYVVSDDGSAIMAMAAGTKQLDAAWAVGTNQGFRDTGSIANGTWHIFAIQRSDTLVTDWLASTSLASPTMPANYDRKAYVGSALREGGALVAFDQDGREFLRKASVRDVAATNPGTSAATRTLSVPTGIVVDAIIHAGLDNSGSGVNPILIISELDQNDEAPSFSAAPLFHGAKTQAVSGGVTSSASRLSVRTNASGQVRSRLSSSDGSTVLTVVTIGWINRQMKRLAA